MWGFWGSFILRDRMVCNESRFIIDGYFVELLLSVDLLGSYVVQWAPEGFAAFLVEDPCVRLVDLVWVKSG